MTGRPGWYGEKRRHSEVQQKSRKRTDFHVETPEEYRRRTERDKDTAARLGHRFIPCANQEDDIEAQLTDLTELVEETGRCTPEQSDRIKELRWQLKQIRGEG